MKAYLCCNVIQMSKFWWKLDEKLFMQIKVEVSYVNQSYAIWKWEKGQRKKKRIWKCKYWKENWNDT